ncbi:excalibur calcium-binding domain-containing protein [Leifsonia kafniensis]
MVSITSAAGSVGAHSRRRAFAALAFAGLVTSLLTVPLSAQATEVTDPLATFVGSSTGAQTPVASAGPGPETQRQTETEPEPAPEIAAAQTQAQAQVPAVTEAPAQVRTEAPAQTQAKTEAPAQAQTQGMTSAAVKTLTATPTPRLSGAAKLGSTLTASAGSWTPATVTLSYQWKRSGTTITGATKPAYKVATADMGKTLTVTVTGKKTGYQMAVMTSAPTGKAFANFTSTPVPSISGSAAIGAKLTATPGIWAPGSAALSYQWKRSGATIAGATGRTYLVSPTDVDRTFTVTVTAKLANYTTVSKQSAATRVVSGVIYKNCDALRAAYPHGVAKAGTKYDRVSGVNKALKGPPFFSTSLYNLNTKSDRDKDGIACEK